jgi:uncharacterized OB-fold protein
MRENTGMFEGPEKTLEVVCRRAHDERFVETSDVGNVALFLEVRRTGDGERKETKGTIAAAGVHGGGIGIHGFMELFQLCPVTESRTEDR